MRTKILQVIGYIRQHLPDPMPVGSRVQVTLGKHRGVSGVVKGLYGTQVYRVRLNSGRGIRNYPRVCLRRKV